MDKSTADRILNDATLPSGNRATAAERLKGRWVLPDDQQHVRVNERLSKFLFEWHPQWCLICVLDVGHVHVEPDGTRKQGVWYIYEANPFKIPRMWYPVVPLIVSEMNSEGKHYVGLDRNRGVVADPDHINLDIVTKTLDYKNVYNTAAHANIKEAVTDIDKYNANRKEGIENDIKKFDEDFTKEIVSDMSAKNTSPKRPNAVLDQYGNEMK